jgi:hypothetical protein
MIAVVMAVLSVSPVYLVAAATIDTKILALSTTWITSSASLRGGNDPGGIREAPIA